MLSDATCRVALCADSLDSDEAPEAKVARLRTRFLEQDVRDLIRRSHRAMRTLQRGVGRESKELRLPACRGGLSSHESPLTTHGSRLYAMRATVCASCATNCCLSTPRLLRVVGMNLTQLKHNRDLLFWSLHALGWSAYGISQYLGALLYRQAGRLRQGHHRRRGWRLRAQRAAALRLPTAVDEAARSDDRRRPAAAYSRRSLWRVVVNSAYAHVHGRDPHMEDMAALRTTSAARSARRI